MKKKIISVFLFFTIIASIGNIYAHSGRTDSQGGHRDNNNVSGLGPYHYHCGGHPAHLHPDGVCPYSNNPNKKVEEKTKNINKKNNTEKRQFVVKKEVEILPKNIKINEEIKEIEVNEEKKLTAKIEPIDVKNKEIKWETSDNTIAIIDNLGNIIGKKEGTVTIKAITANGIEDNIIIKVKEKADESEIVEERVENNSGKEILGTAAIGGIPFLGYQLLKKKEQ